MRYLVTARVKEGKESALDCAIEDGTLGRGSIAGDEYQRNMQEARLFADGRLQWIEVCYCSSPLAEERPYWEKFFHLLKIQDAHARSRCQHLNGTRTWACDECDCTTKLEERLRARGIPFRDGDR
jgi:hypothetical protein